MQAKGEGDKRMFFEVKTKDRTEIVGSLAREIWTEHYSPIIGKYQVRCMLHKFQ